MRKAFLVCLMGVAYLIGVGGREARAVASVDDQQKSKILQQISISKAVLIQADNSQGSPLYIQEASVKEISGDDFAILVGESPKHFRQTTFPEVTLMNNSAKVIKSFALVAKSAAEDPKSGHILIKRNVTIPPNSAFKVSSSEWIKAESTSVQKDGKFLTGWRQPGLDSARSWLAGGASDLRVTVGLVDFEDGKRWMISPDSNWEE
jgi:hypothetical protein